MRKTALIWLNKFNADTLNKQLKQQQNITLQEFSDKKTYSFKSIERFSRMERMQVPPIDFFQLKVSYQTLIIDEDTHTAERLTDKGILRQAELSIIHHQDMEGHIIGHYEEENNRTMKSLLSIIGYNSLPKKASVHSPFRN